MSLKSIPIRGLLGATALCASLAAPAHAADNTSAAVPADADTQQTDSGQLSEITVTAERRRDSTNLIKTPISISVVGSQDLENRHIYSLTDLNDGSAPGLTVTPYASRPFNMILNIRGVGVMTDTNQPSGESGVGVYIDGVYLGRPQGLDAGLYDLESVEVLKGPQGTLFGRNTEGGALNITTKKPTGQFGLNMLAGIGNYGSYESQFHLNLPEYHNLSVKLDGMIQAHDGWVKNPMPGQSDWNAAARRGVRAQVRWTPASNFTADYSFDISHTEDTTTFGYTVRPANNVIISPLSFVATSRIDVAPVGVPLQPSIGDQYGHALTMKWDVAPWLQLKSITAYRHLYQNQYQNGGTEALAITTKTGDGQNFERYSLAEFNQHQYSQELQAIGSLGRVKFIVGGMFFHERTQDQAQAFNTLHWDSTGTASGITPIVYTPYGNSLVGPNGCITSPASCSSVLNNFYGQPGQTTLLKGLYPNIGIDRASWNKTDSLGIYGQATWTPAIIQDRLHLTGGLRWNDDRKHGQLFIVNNQLPFLPGANGQLTAVQGPIEHIQSWKRVDPMINIAFDVSQSASLYGKWGTAYRAGGFNSRSITYSSYNPESISMFEVGFKGEFFNHHARFDIAGYTGTYKDVYYNISANYNTFATDCSSGTCLQYVVSGSTRTVEDTYNMQGKGRVSGIEADFELAPVRGLTLSGSYTYAYVRMPLFADPIPRVQTDSSGKVLGYALNTPTLYHQLYTPKNRVTGAIDYQTRVANDYTVRFHFDGNWNDGQYTSTGDVSTGTKDANGNTIYVPVNKSQPGAIFNSRISVGGIRLASSDAKLDVAFWVRNLFDANIMTSRGGNYSILSSAISGGFNDPRTFGGTVSVKF